jgi:DNA polymerase I
MSSAARPPVVALLDGHSLAYRAFYALPDDLRTTTGQLTNAVYGFTSMLIKLLAEHRPDGIAVLFDSGRPAERLAILPEYKATRAETPDAFRSQLPLIDEVLDTLDVPRIAMEGCEADDLIATYAALATEAGMDALVVTGDRDVFQLIDEHTTVLYTRRGITDTVLMDAKAVEERYGVPPELYPQLAALRGDPSDNIPGVPGVGDKTAAKLLVEFGDLDGVFANLDKVKGKKLPDALAEHQQAVLDGLAVARLRRDLEVPRPVEALRMGNPETEAIRRLFATLEFRALWERLSTQVLAAQAEQEADTFMADPQRLGAGGVAAWLAARDRSQPLAVVPFTEGRPPDLRLVEIGLAAPGARPAAALVGDLADEDLDMLAAAVADPDRWLVVHGLKRLLHAADSRGWRIAGVQTDTELAAYLVQPQQRSYDLEDLALQYLNKELRAGEGAAEGQLALAVEDEWRHRALRAEAVLELAEVLSDELAERDQAPLLSHLELPLVPVLTDMERTGIAVDLAVLEEIGETLGDRIRGLREEIYRTWLAKRLGKAARLESARMVRFERTKAERRKRLDGPDATFHGELTISDGAAFSELLASGLGRHTAYGYGMLLLRPARQ